MTDTTNLSDCQNSAASGILLPCRLFFNHQTPLPLHVHFSKEWKLAESFKTIYCCHSETFSYLLHTFHHETYNVFQDKQQWIRWQASKTLDKCRRGERSAKVDGWMEENGWIKIDYIGRNGRQIKYGTGTEDDIIRKGERNWEKIKGNEGTRRKWSREGFRKEEIRMDLGGGQEKGTTWRVDEWSLETVEGMCGKGGVAGGKSPTKKQWINDWDKGNGLRQE